MICGVKLSVVLFLNIKNRVKKGRVVMGFENLPIPLKKLSQVCIFPTTLVSKGFERSVYWIEFLKQKLRIKAQQTSIDFFTHKTLK